MLIGVISDTHNEFAGINRAIEFFNLRNVDLVLHCGDICLPQHAKAFENLNCGFKAVYGNNDFHQTELEKVIAPFGSIHTAPHEFKFQDKNFVMMHFPLGYGFNVDVKKFDYILYGHTHQAKIEEVGKTTYLNPGEACGWRFGKKTVALIDLEKNTSEIFELKS